MPNTFYHTPKYNNGAWVRKSLKTEMKKSIARKAVVGEKIIITKKHYASDFYTGDIFTVTEVREEIVKVEGEAQGVCHWEYEVITESVEVYK